MTDEGLAQSQEKLIRQASIALIKYGVSVDDLNELCESKDIKKLASFGGPDKIATMLHTDFVKGITVDEHDIHSRQKTFGKNVFPIQKQKAFWKYIYESFQDFTLMILIAAATATLVFGVLVNIQDATKPEWIDALGIFLAVFLVVSVTSVQNYNQERQFKKLNKTKDNKLITVLRDGDQQQISIFDLLVGDMVKIESGDTVPADGILVHGFDVSCDESQMTGETDMVKKNDSKPFLISNCKVTTGTGTMLVLATGINTAWGKTKLALMGKIPKTEEMKFAEALDEDENSEEEEGGKKRSKLAIAWSNSSLKKKLDKIEEFIKVKILLQDEEARKTPLQEKLEDLAGLIGKVGTVVAVLNFLALMVKFAILMTFFYDSTTGGVGGFELITLILLKLLNNFVMAITIIVVAVPEGLPLAVTISLAYSMKKMIKDKNLVRQLKACETMGEATIICSDKTGTLTTNQMTVVQGNFLGEHVESFEFSADEIMESSDSKNSEEAYIKVKRDIQDQMRKQFGDYYDLLNIGIALNCTADIRIEYKKQGKIVTYLGSKTEGALLQLSSDNFGFDFKKCRDDKQDNIAHVYTFSSKRKRMSSILKTGDGAYTIYCKGASEIVLGLCTKYISKDGSVADIDTDMRKKMEQDIIAMASSGLRTLCLALKDFRCDSEEDLADASLIENDLICICLVGIKDPLRSGVMPAMDMCSGAGITVKMLTGDNILTAKYIAKECGILTEDGTAILGSEWRSMSRSKRLQILPKLQVMARSTPIDKLTLVKLLRESGEVVGVTGDGTNDAPALKEADVGLSMGLSGTEIAKDASDIVIMDDKFSSIVQAVKWGRSVYENIRKFLQFQITINIVALVLTFFVSVESDHFPLTPVQLLWVNMVMDTFAALALATEPPSASLLKKKPCTAEEPLISNNMWKHILVQSFYQLFVCFYLIYGHKDLINLATRKNAWDWDFSFLTRNISKDDYSLLFNTFVLMQVFNEFNCRKIYNEFNIFHNLHKSLIFIFIILLTILIQSFVINVGFIPGIEDIVDALIHTRPLNFFDWGVGFFFGALCIPISSFFRIFRLREGPWCGLKKSKVTPGQTEKIVSNSFEEEKQEDSSLENKTLNQEEEENNVQQNNANPVDVSKEQFVDIAKEPVQLYADG